jgi:hypothetical protein
VRTETGYSASFNAVKADIRRMAARGRWGERDG